MDNLRKLKETLEAISKECENTTSEECSKCKYSNNGFCINAPYNWELDEIERFLAKKEGKL